jgi:hypothetical protein
VEPPTIIEDQVPHTAHRRAVIGYERAVFSDE